MTRHAASWEAILDPAMWGGDDVQATLQEIRVEDLVQVIRVW